MRSIVVVRNPIINEYNIPRYRIDNGDKVYFFIQSSNSSENMLESYIIDSQESNHLWGFLYRVSLDSDSTELCPRSLCVDPLKLWWSSLDTPSTASSTNEGRRRGCRNVVENGLKCWVLWAVDAFWMGKLGILQKPSVSGRNRGGRFGQSMLIDARVYPAEHFTSVPKYGLQLVCMVVWALIFAEHKVLYQGTASRLRGGIQGWTSPFVLGQFSDIPPLMRAEVD